MSCLIGCAVTLATVQAQVDSSQTRAEDFAAWVATLDVAPMADLETAARSTDWNVRREALDAIGRRSPAEALAVVDRLIATGLPAEGVAAACNLRAGLLRPTPRGSDADVTYLRSYLWAPRCTEQVRVDPWWAVRELADLGRSDTWPEIERALTEHGLGGYEEVRWLRTEMALASRGFDGLREGLVHEARRIRRWAFDRLRTWPNREETIALANGLIDAANARWDELQQHVPVGDAWVAEYTREWGRGYPEAAELLREAGVARTDLNPRLVLVFPPRAFGSGSTQGQLDIPDER